MMSHMLIGFRGDGCIISRATRGNNKQQKRPIKARAKGNVVKRSLNKAMSSN